MTEIENLKQELRSEVEPSLQKALDWLAPKMPKWVERIPPTPEWINPMFVIYCAIAGHAIGLLAAWLTP